MYVQKAACVCRRPLLSGKIFGSSGVRLLGAEDNPSVNDTDAFALVVDDHRVCIGLQDLVAQVTDYVGVAA